MYNRKADAASFLAGKIYVCHTCVVQPLVPVYSILFILLCLYHVCVINVAHPQRGRTASYQRRAKASP